MQEHEKEESAIFNLLPKFLSVITGPGERQLQEGGYNALDACGPAAGSVLMQVLGYPDIEPQVWTDYEYWPTYRGGETYEALNDFIASRYPNPPLMSIESPADQLAAIDQWGSAGLLVIGLFWSTGGAVYQSYRTGIGHFGLILGYDGTTVTVWNPELGVQDLSLALFRGASQNLFDVCHRSLGSATATAGSEVIVPQGELVMTPGEILLQARISIRTAAMMAGQRHLSDDLHEYANWVNDFVTAATPGSGKSADAVLAQFIAGLSLPPPVAGPPGPAGPAGPAAAPVDITKFSTKGHAHDATIQPDK